MKSITKIGLSVLFWAMTGASAFAYNTAALPANTYVSDNGLDWTWVSPWGTYNEGVKFASPSAHAGWRYASVNELQYLFSNLVDDFLNGGNPIQSVSYWELDGTNWVDQGDLQGGYIMSGGNFFNSACSSAPCEVFYVRDANQVPTPGSLALLGIGALALGLSRRKKVVA